eukprot:41076-Eustigmatos_ZCMA.PRE.1
MPDEVLSHCVANQRRGRILVPSCPGQAASSPLTVRMTRKCSYHCRPRFGVLLGHPSSAICGAPTVGFGRSNLDI